MIDHQLPKDWKDLQEKVAQIFGEIGYKTETDKKLKLVRGTVNVDVYSEDITQSPNIIYVCECKHWNRNVPRTVIHSFRTVMQDFGAHYGIVISKKGFQRGAYEASKNTNIKLVNWLDFQELFEDKWLPAMADKVYEKCEAFTDYTEPMVGAALHRRIQAIEKDKAKKIEIFNRLRRKYMAIGTTIVSLRFGRWLMKKKTVFPIFPNIPSEKENEAKSVEISSYRDLFAFLLCWGEKGKREFDEIFEESN